MDYLGAAAQTMPNDNPVALQIKSFLKKINEERIGFGIYRRCCNPDPETAVVQSVEAGVAGIRLHIER